MRATESKSYSNITADTSPFWIYGGRYMLTAVATWGGGNVVLETIGPDGSTYLAVANLADDAVEANGSFYYDLPPGQYRFNLTTATGVYLKLTRVPLE